MKDKNEFYREVYCLVAAIPAGCVLTYGQIARLTGWPHHSRLVGKALREAPEALKLPCHRVVNSRGGTVPSWARQRELLEKEGVAFKKNHCVNLATHQWALVNDLSF